MHTKNAIRLAPNCLATLMTDISIEILGGKLDSINKTYLLIKTLSIMKNYPSCLQHVTPKKWRVGKVAADKLV